MKWFVLFLIAPLAACAIGCTERRLVLPVGREIRWTMHAPVATLDPIRAGDTDSLQQIRMTYEGLYALDPSKTSADLVPNLAENLPEISDQGKTLKIRLRKGVRFQDDAIFPGGKGREVRARDFIESWKRLADPRASAPAYWMIQDQIVGLEGWRDRIFENPSAYDAEISGLVAPDDFTLEIRLMAPSPSLLQFLAHPASYVVPIEAVTKYGRAFAFHPIGTGPFILRVEESSLNRSLVWVPNPSFRNPGVNLETSPSVIRFDVVTAPELEWEQLARGESDGLEVPADHLTKILNSERRLRKSLEKRGFHLEIAPRAEFLALGFNQKSAWFAGRKNVRQALSLSLSSELFNRAFFPENALVAEGPLPPASEGYDAGFRNPFRQFGLAQARDLLGKVDRKEAVLVIQQGTVEHRMALFVRDALKSLGIDVEIRTVSASEWAQKIQSSSTDLFFFSWRLDYPLAEAAFAPFHPVANVLPIGLTGTPAALFEQVWTELRRVSDAPKRKELAKRLMEFVTDECPVIFLNHPVSYVLVQGRVGSYRNHPFDFAAPPHWTVNPTQPREVVSADDLR